MCRLGVVCDLYYFGVCIMCFALLLCSTCFVLCVMCDVFRLQCFTCFVLFFRGKGDYFRLGHGNDSHVRKPQIVEGLKGAGYAIPTPHQSSISMVGWTQRKTTRLVASIYGISEDVRARMLNSTAQKLLQLKTGPRDDIVGLSPPRHPHGYHGG